MLLDKFYFIFIISNMIFCDLHAQNRYAVFFKHKPQTSFSLNNPKEFLTSKALDRRIREKIQFDSLDLPVSERYLQEVRALSVEYLYASKWLNAAVLVTDESRAKNLQNLPFVDKVELIGLGFLRRPGSRELENQELAQIQDSNKIHPKWRQRIVESQNNSYDFQNQLIGIDEMHKAGFTGKGVTIAVFDAGFPGMKTASPFSHLFTKSQVIGQKDLVRNWNEDVFLDNQHGTNVTSLIASNEPGKLVAGAFNANYILAITEEVATEYRVEEFNWVRAAEYADSLGVDIVNSSLGYYDFDDPKMNYTKQQLDGKTTYITKGANIASEKGILVVNSVGNYGSTGTSSLVAPADAFGILSVGSVTSASVVSSFSSRGPTADGRVKPELSAFGHAPVLVRSNGSIGTGQGTSFSAPQIAALAAGLWEARPEWTKDQVILNLLRSATQYDKPDNNLGYGIPDFGEAYFGKILGVEPEEIIPLRVYPNPIQSDELSIWFGSDKILDIQLVDVSGRKIREEKLNRNSIKNPYLINLDLLQPGLYILYLNDQKNTAQTKLIKKF